MVLTTLSHMEVDERRKACVTPVLKRNALKGKKPLNIAGNTNFRSENRQCALTRKVVYPEVKRNGITEFRTLSSTEVFVSPCRVRKFPFSPTMRRTGNRFSKSALDFSNNLRFLSSVAAKPHKDKTGLGEDAFFVGHNHRSLGIADGVGGWGEFGIDAGLYSRKLMTSCMYHIEREAAGIADPVNCLAQAFEEMKETKGGTTCCVVVLEENKLKVANIGDSGLLLFRRKCFMGLEEDKENQDPNKSRTSDLEWRPVFKTEDMLHYFNCPLQIGTESIDKPEDADVYEIPCKPGDLILLGTDGLFDNLSVQEITAIVNEVEEGSKIPLSPSLDDDFLESPQPATRLGNWSTSPRAVPKRRRLKEGSVLTSLTRKQETSFLDQLVHKLASRAFESSVDPFADTPFARGAKLNGMTFQGGKPDDVTIIASKVVGDSPINVPYEPEKEPCPSIDLVKMGEDVTNITSVSNLLEEFDHMAQPFIP